MTAPAEKPAKQTCGNCRFWREGREDRGDEGTCHRFPPQYAATGRFPMTLGRSWCGEWQWVKQ